MVNSTTLDSRLIYKIGFDEFMKLAEEAYEKNTLHFNFENGFFLSEYKNNPKLISFLKKIRKGK
jgi:hypothetical protein